VIANACIGACNDESLAMQNRNVPSRPVLAHANKMLPHPKRHQLSRKLPHFVP
jgi:hypothetical protein